MITTILFEKHSSAFFNNLNKTFSGLVSLLPLLTLLDHILVAFGPLAFKISQSLGLQVRMKFIFIRSELDAQMCPCFVFIRQFSYWNFE